MKNKPESGEIDVAGEATFAGPRGCLLPARSAKREKWCPNKLRKQKRARQKKKEHVDDQLVKIRSRYAKIQP
jgi:hypothetical protein